MKAITYERYGHARLTTGATLLEARDEAALAEALAAAPELAARVRPLGPTTALCAPGPGVPESGGPGSGSRTSGGSEPHAAIATMKQMSARAARFELVSNAAPPGARSPTCARGPLTHRR